MGWAEDRVVCRNQDSISNFADFVDSFFKIGLKPDFKEEAKPKNKSFLLLLFI